MVLAILASLAIFYPEFFMVKGAFVTADHKEQHFPWAWTLAGHLKSFSLPWWTAQIHCGFPLAAEGQVGAFYLPNLIFYFLLPIKAAYSYLTIFHFFLAGVFMYVYAVSLGLKRISAFLCALVFLYGSMYGGFFYNITSLKVLCWFPLTLFLIRDIAERLRLRDGFYLGLIFFLQVAAGYLQIACYSIFIASAYFLLYFWLAKSKEPGSFTYFLKASCLYGLALVVCFLLSWPQLGMTFELAGFSNRVALGESFAYIGSFSPLGLVTLLYPVWDAYLRGGCLYGGMMTLFFISLAYLARKDRGVKLHFALALLALLMAMGMFSPLYVLIIKLTKLYSLRVPAKFIFFTSFSLTVLAGYGCDLLLGEEGAFRPALKKGTKYFAALAAASAGAIIVGGIILKTARGPLLRLGSRLVEGLIHNKPGHPHSLAEYYAKLEDYLSGITALADLSKPAILYPTLAAVSLALFLYLFRRSRLSSKAFVGISLALIFLDLYGYGFADVKRDYIEYSKALAKPAILRFFENDKDIFRVYGYRSVTESLPIVPSYNMIFGLDEVGAYSPLVTKDYYDFMGGFGAVNDSVTAKPVKEDYLLTHLTALGMINVKYVMALKEVKDDDLLPLASENGLYLYLNKRHKPRFLLVKDCEVIKDRELMLRRTQEMAFSPEEKIYLEEEPPAVSGVFGQGLSAEEDIEVLEYGDGEVSLKVSAGKARFLFVSELFYPGWQAYVDGRKVKIYRANYCFKAIVLPPGNCDVTFKYKPTIFQEGYISNLLRRK